MKSVFLIFVEDNAHEMLTYESFKLQRDRQYTMFVVRIKMNPRYILNQNRLRFIKHTSSAQFASRFLFGFFLQKQKTTCP